MVPIKSGFRPNTRAQQSIRISWHSSVVEQRTCNAQVGGSSPSASSEIPGYKIRGFFIYCEGRSTTRRVVDSWRGFPINRDFASLNKSLCQLQNPRMKIRGFFYGNHKTH